MTNGFLHALVHHAYHAVPLRCTSCSPPETFVRTALTSMSHTDILLDGADYQSGDSLLPVRPSGVCVLLHAVYSSLFHLATAWYPRTGAYPDRQLRSLGTSTPVVCFSMSAWLVVRWNGK
jgi:hypothetical protein